MQSCAFWDNFERCYGCILSSSWPCSLSFSVLRQGILTSSALTSLLLNDFCQYSYSHYTVMVTIYLRGNLVLFFGRGGGGSFYSSNILDRQQQQQKQKSLHVNFYIDMSILNEAYMSWSYCKVYERGFRGDTVRLSSHCSATYANGFGSSCPFKSRRCK